MSLEEILKKYYGFSRFKPAQKKLILKIITGNDVLAILPTGFGKSLIYQIAGLALNGLTLVITPLISLMKDQVDALNKRNIKAAYLNSLMENKQIREILKNIDSYSFLYVSPERLNNLEFRKSLPKLSLIVMDEAHTLLWGEEFREAMLEIKPFINSLKSRPIVSAFTATANLDTTKFIIKALGLKNPYIEYHSPVKKNLEIKALEGNNDYLLDKLLLKQESSKIIIYALTRKSVMTIYNRYKDIYKISYYHGGLARELKLKNQEEFTENKKNIMVATVAFGMGIDIKDIRSVILYDLPLSLADLVQEIGRAGRDNKQAFAYILLSKKSLREAEFLAKAHNNRLQALEELDQVLNFFYTKNKKAFLDKYFETTYFKK